MTQRLTAKTMTKPEALAVFAAADETACHTWCLPQDVFVSVGKDWLPLDMLNEMEREGLITIRLETVPCAPMGSRTPPIRHCKVKSSGGQELL